MLSECIHMKRSVYRHNTRTQDPYYFLKMCKFAYDHAPLLTKETQLMYAAMMGNIYQGALRVSEAVDEKGLTRRQFTHETSASGHPFLVINNVITEKTEGRIRSIPLFEGDPITKVIIAYLDLFDSKQGVYQVLYEVSRFTALNVIKRFTDGQGWTHWLRSQRISHLSSFLTPFELDAFGGWGAKKPKNPRDYYVHRQWMDYADKIARASKEYWPRAIIEPEVNSWLASLGSTTTTAK